MQRIEALGLAKSLAAVGVGALVLVGLHFGGILPNDLSAVAALAGIGAMLGGFFMGVLLLGCFFGKK